MYIYIVYTHVQATKVPAFFVAFIHFCFSLFFSCTHTYRYQTFPRQPKCQPFSSPSFIFFLFSFHSFFFLFFLYTHVQVSNFSKATKVPAFFVAFIITPFASNASELVSFSFSFFFFLFSFLFFSFFFSLFFFFFFFFF